MKAVPQWKASLLIVARWPDASPITVSSVWPASAGWRARERAAIVVSICHTLCLL